MSLEKPPHPDVLSRIVSSNGMSSNGDNSFEILLVTTLLDDLEEETFKWDLHINLQMCFFHDTDSKSFEAIQELIDQLCSINPF